MKGNPSMVWRNLRRNKCPKCAHDLTHNVNTEVLECGGMMCDFAITAARMQEIVGSMNKEAIETPMYRQGELVEDMHKTNWPQCSLCHDKHDPEARCEGFGE